MSIDYFPLDVGQLAKGQVITIAELEKLIGLKFPDYHWSLRVCGLQGRINKQRTRRGMTLLTMYQRKGELVICDEVAASVYGRKRVRHGARKIRRAHEAMRDVDDSKMSPEEQKRHQRWLSQMAMMRASISAIRHGRIPQVKRPERVTPPMVPGPAQNATG